MQNIFCNLISFDIGVKCDVGMFLAGFMRFSLIVPWLCLNKPLRNVLCCKDGAIVQTYLYICITLLDGRLLDFCMNPTNYA